MVLLEKLKQRKGKSMIKTWEEALADFKFPRRDGDTYREGFRSGWLDCYLGHDSRTARTSTWGYYAMGYSDGHRSYFQYNPVEQVGEITCLQSLLG